METANESTSNGNQKICIIGCGQIGSQWATLFASAGFRVCLYDVNTERVNTAKRAIIQRLRTLEENGLLRGSGTADQQFQNVSVALDLADCVRGAAYCQESIAEGQTFKQTMFIKLGELIDDNTILASSTSTIPASSFTEHLPRRSQCLVAHPINPPIYVRLVEVVPTPWTSEECVVRTMSLMKKIGQVPVRLMKEVSGFALNRIQFAIIAESWRLVSEGILSPEDVDKVMKEGMGPRYAFYGPLEVMHLNANGIEDYIKRFMGGVVKVLETLGGMPDFAEEGTEKEIVHSLNEQMPLSKLTQFASERERYLAELCKLKKNFQPQV